MFCITRVWSRHDLASPVVSKNLLFKTRKKFIIRLINEICDAKFECVDLQRRKQVFYIIDFKPIGVRSTNNSIKKEHHSLLRNYKMVVNHCSKNGFDKISSLFITERFSMIDCQKINLSFLIILSDAFLIKLLDDTYPL